MWIGGQTLHALLLGADLLPIIAKTLRAQGAFEISTRINTRCRMRLKIDEVTTKIACTGTEKMIEADLK